MAVIKIVPMPGAKGDQGDAGAVGPQGPQGETGATGPAGSDAIWYYNGEYNPGASYVIGDVVTYEGQTWYRKHANGGNVGDTPSEGPFWDLIAAKGLDWAYQTSSGMWDTYIKQQSNISGGYSIGLDLPSMGTYTKMGNVVDFYLTYNLTDHYEDTNYPMSFQGSGGGNISFKLPFPIQQSIHGGPASNGYDYGANTFIFYGRMFGRVDVMPPDGVFNQPDEEGWIEVQGIGYTDESNPNDRKSYVILQAQDYENINTHTKTWKAVTHSWPFDFAGTSGHRFFLLQINGSYICEV